MDFRGTDRDSKVSYTCDNCSQTIKKSRFHCENCGDFDLCENCKQTYPSSHSSQHTLLCLSI